MDNEEKIERAISLVEEMLFLAAEQDKKHKAAAIAKGKGEQAIGESWELFYLKNLKDLLES
jgi:hypothetical protein